MICSYESLRKGTVFFEQLCQEEPMKTFARICLMGSGLGLIFLTAVPSFATVVGTLNTGGNGTVTVTPTGITFTENDSSGGSTEVGTGTTLTYAGGSLTVGQPIDIAGGDTITPTTLPATMTFPDEPTLSITLDSFGPGSSNTDCSGLTTGESCSPALGGGLVSPIILTAVGNGTSALLFVSGTAMDGSGTTDVSGNFSANIAGESPEELANAKTFTTTYSGQLTLAASAVPEPRTISLVIIAGLLMGLVVKRRKGEA
jgi:hypothetical protein